MRTLFPPWRPDQAAISGAGAVDAYNVIKTSSGYKALGQPVFAGPQLPGLLNNPKAVLGFVSTKDKSNNAFDYAVLGKKIYSLTGGAWVDVSNPANANGYAVTADVNRLAATLTSYFTSRTQGKWRFTQYNNLLIGTDGANNVQVMTLGSAQPFSDLSASAPKGYYIAQCRGFVVLGNTTDIYDGHMGMRLWWSALDDPGTWGGNAAITQSDFQDMQNAGNIQAVIGGQYLTVLMEQGIYIGEYVGAPVIFDFSLIANAKGCSCAGSVIVVGVNIYYLADDGFYSLALGQYPQPISNQKISAWFHANANMAFLEYMDAGYNDVENAIFWTFCSNAAQEGIPDMFLVYQIDTNEFTYFKDSMLLFGTLVSPATTLDEIVPTLDTLAVPLDSSTLSGGTPSNAAMNAAGIPIVFTGTSYAGLIETPEVQLAPGLRSVVTQLSLLAETTATAQVSIGARQRIGDAVTWEAPRSVQPSGLFYSRKEGRYHRMRALLASGWSSATGVDVSGQPTSMR
jgi:hypothetical protein